MNDALRAVVANHLWQCTLFAAAIWALTLLLRQNNARVRYLLWLAASVKFLVPFALLAAMGTQFSWQPEVGDPGTAAPHILEVAGDLAAPMAGNLPYPPFDSQLRTLFEHENQSNWYRLALLVWIVGTMLVAGRWLKHWLEVRRAVRKSVALTGINFPALVRSTEKQLEPGIVGIIRPALLLPSGIEEHLTREQLHAVLAHERCHLRWRDNLAAALHMLIEAVFWFHPLVWWIGARMIEERERACDEQVVRDGHAPENYAEGILNICEHYIASRLPCVSGVSGADLRQRIESILKRAIALKLDRPKKLVLAAFTCCAVAAPITAGIISGSAVEVLFSSSYNAALAGASELGPFINGRQIFAFRFDRTLPAWSCAAPDQEFARRQKRLATKATRLSTADGEDVLQIAVSANSSNDVRRLLMEGPARSGDELNNLMILAGIFADVRMLELLTNAGANIDAGIGDELHTETPLVWSIHNGHRDNVRWLLQHGADVNITNMAGVPALIPAMVACKDQQLVTQLMQAGARPDARAIDIAKNMGFDLRMDAAHLDRRGIKDE